MRQPRRGRRRLPAGRLGFLREAYVFEEGANAPDVSPYTAARPV